MALKPLPSRELLHQLLRYDAETGDLIWLAQPREMFAARKHHLCWNTRYAGKVAGYARPCRNNVAYLHIGIRGYSILKAHRLVWLHVRGDPVPDMIDHIDNDSLNNRIENLRAATMPLNRANSKVRKDSKTGYKGIRLSRHNRFIVNAGPAPSYRGTYKTIEEAIAVYKEVTTAHYGDFSRWDQRQ